MLPVCKGRCGFSGSVPETAKFCKIVIKPTIDPEVSWTEISKYAGMVTVTTADAKLYIPMGQLVDVAKELDRVGKELEKARKNLAGIESKLSNEKFTARAPEAVVAAEREKAEKARELIAQLEENESSLKKLC